MRRSLVCLAAVFLAGCVRYQAKPLQPEASQAAFLARSLSDPGLKDYAASAGVAAWPPEAWDLKCLVLAASYFHSELAVARAQWVSARAAEITAGARPNPTLSLFHQHDVNAGADVTSAWTLGPLLDLPVETAGKRDLRLEQARAASETARMHVASVVWDLRSRLRERMLVLARTRREEALLEARRADQEALLGFMDKRLEAGEASLPDLAPPRAELGRTRLALQQARVRSAEALGRLAQAIGVPASALAGAPLSFDAFERTPAGDGLPTRDVLHQALLRRPDLLEILGEYAAREAALRLEVAKQYPDLHLGPGYSWDQGHNKWSLGFSLALPVFDRNRGPIGEAEARRAETAARFEDLQARVVGELDQALAAYASARQGMDEAASLEAEQERRLGRAEALSKAGEEDALSLLSARVDLSAAQEASLEAWGRAQEALGSLEAATGRPLDLKDTNKEGGS